MIRSKIYEIRGQKVMLDFDLASMYGVETSQLKRAVRRNLERFEGDDFMFELTKDELSRCQIGTLNGGRGSNIKYLPFAFTELGVAILSSVLRSATAIEINRGIMRAFFTVRQMIAANPITLRLSPLKRTLKNLSRILKKSSPTTTISTKTRAFNWKPSIRLLQTYRLTERKPLHTSA